MAKHLISIPTAIYIDVTDEDLNGRDLDNLAVDDFLIDQVFEQYGKYITVDARDFGYDNYTVIDSFDE